MGYSILRSITLALMAGSASVFLQSTAQPVSSDPAIVPDIQQQQPVAFDLPAIESAVVADRALAKTKVVAIIGAGMAGFAAAKHLSRYAPDANSTFLYFFDCIPF